MTPPVAGQDRRLGHLAMLAFAALVAGSFALGARAAPHIDPAALNAVRFWIAAVPLVLIARARGARPRDGLTAPWRYAVLGGLYGLYFVLMFAGLAIAEPVSLSAVFTLVPLMSGGFALFILGQGMGGRVLLPLLIGGAGALWVIFRGDLAALVAFDVGRGEAIYFVACVAHAVYTPLVRRLNRGENALVFALWTVIGGGVLLTLTGAGAIVATDWLHLPGIVWVTLFYTALFATAASVFLLQFAALRLPSAKVMAYTYLIPSCVIIWQLALGAEPPPLRVMAGVALSILALVLLLGE